VLDHVFAGWRGAGSVAVLGPLRPVADDQDGRRATTPQQLCFLRARMPLATRRAVLMVTSSIYVPYQFFSGAPEVVADGAETSR